MSSLALIAALPREIAGLIRSNAPGASPDPTLARQGILLYRLPRAIVVAAGMGRERAALAVQVALRAAAAEEPITELISIGLAGSCSPALAVATVVLATQVIDLHTGERYATGPGVGQPVLLASTDQIASVAEKARLASSYSAALVDMEAATVGRLARAHGLGFRAIKAVSDAYDFELAALNRFTGKRGTFRTAAFAAYTALHPRDWSAAAQLGRNSSLALRALDRHLGHLLADL